MRCVFCATTARRAFENHLRRAVVLFEANGLRVGKILFELEDVADVRAAPGVDGLVFIADDADVAVFTKELHQLVLRTVRVLVLVDEQILVLAVVALADFARRLQQANGFEQQIVEVHRVRLEEFVAIDLEDVRDLFFERIRRREEVLLRIDHVVLRPGDPSKRDAGLQLLVVDAEPLERLLDDGLLIGLVVDGKALREALAADAQGFDVATQYAHAKAVERRERRLRERGVAENLFDTLLHLLRGFVGEGDGEDVVWADSALLNQVRDAMRDDTCLTGACAGEQKHRHHRRM